MNGIVLHSSGLIWLHGKSNSPTFWSGQCLSPKIVGTVMRDGTSSSFIPAFNAVVQIFSWTQTLTMCKWSTFKRKKILMRCWDGFPFYEWLIVNQSIIWFLSFVQIFAILLMPACGTLQPSSTHQSWIIRTNAARAFPPVKEAATAIYRPYKCIPCWHLIRHKIRF